METPLPKRKTKDLRKAPPYGTLDEQNEFYKKLKIRLDRQERIVDKVNYYHDVKTEDDDHARF